MTPAHAVILAYLLVVCLAIADSVPVVATEDLDERNFLFDHEHPVFEEEESPHVDLSDDIYQNKFEAIPASQLFNDTNAHAKDATVPVRVRVRGDGFTLTAPLNGRPRKHRHMTAFLDEHTHHAGRKQRRAALHNSLQPQAQRDTTPSPIPVLAQVGENSTPRTHTPTGDPDDVPIDISFPPMSLYPPGGLPPARVVSQRHVGLSELRTGQYEYAFLIDAGSTGSRIYLYRMHPRVRTLSLDAHPAPADGSTATATNATTTEDTVARNPSDGASVPSTPPIEASVTSSETHRWHSRAWGSLEMLPGLTPPLSRPVTESGWSLKVMPGVSDYAASPLALHAEHMRPLLAFALALMRELGVEDKVPHTPVFFTATGGVRALHDDRREALLRVVRASLLSSGFYFHPSFARVLAGEEEGVFGWLTVNYLASNRTLFWREDEQASRHTVGALDLGGASTQATFRPRKGSTLLAHQYPLRVAHTDNSLYTECFWYYGKDSALWRVHNILYAVSFYEDAVEEHAEAADDTASQTHASADELGLYGQNDRAGDDMEAQLRRYNATIAPAVTASPQVTASSATPPAHTDSAVLSDGHASESTAASTPDATASAADEEAERRRRKLERKVARKTERKASRARTDALRRLLPVDWDLPLNSTRIDDAGRSGKRVNAHDGVPDDLAHLRAFASPCLPTGFSARFRAFNDDGVRVEGRADWDACYAIAVHLVHTRTTGPCHAARAAHLHDKERPGLPMDAPDTASTPTTAADEPLPATRDKAAVKLAKAGVKARKAQQATSTAWSREVPFQGQCTSFFGLYEPDLSGRLFHAFSGFSYLPTFLGLPEDASLHELAASGRALCALSWAQLQEQHPHANKYYLRSYCWLSVYAVALLHEGFRFPLHARTLRWTRQLAGTDVTYALGAALYELNRLPWSIALDYGHLHAHDRDDDLSVPSAAASPPAFPGAEPVTSGHPADVVVASGGLTGRSPLTATGAVDVHNTATAVDTSAHADGGALCSGAWSEPNRVSSGPMPADALSQLAGVVAERQYYRNAFYAALCALLALVLGTLYLWMYSSRARVASAGVDGDHGNVQSERVLHRYDREDARDDANTRVAAPARTVAGRGTREDAPLLNEV